MATQLPQQPEYPVQFSVDYPDRELSRVTTAFRIFTIIPIAIVLSTVSGGTWQCVLPARGHARPVAVARWPALARAVAHDPVPRRSTRAGGSTGTSNCSGSSNRVGVYLALMDDRYPSTDEHQSVQLELRLPGCGSVT